jgi:F-type H+-transporting ATPase subunit gamma
MSNLKEVRTRIGSIRSTRQITSAMKMVSASKLHRAQQSIVPIRVYSAHLRGIIGDILPQLPHSARNQFVEPVGMGEALVVSVSSNKGLCGTYNALAIRKTLTHVRALEEEGYKVKLFLIGKKAERFFDKAGFEVYASDHELVDKADPASAAQFSRSLLDAFSEGAFERVDVVYYQFRNAVFQKLVVEQVLPLDLASLASGTEDGPVPNENDSGERAHFGFILEPDPEDVCETLIPRFFSTNFYRIFMESSASEHGARMTSMHKATDNADELLHSLTLTYNKARQAQITREIMEIVGGAEVFRQ